MKIFAQGRDISEPIYSYIKTDKLQVKTITENWISINIYQLIEIFNYIEEFLVKEDVLSNLLYNIEESVEEFLSDLIIRFLPFHQIFITTHSPFILNYQDENLEKMDDLWREMKANFYWFKSYLDLKCDIFLKQADHYKEVGNYKKRLGRLKRRKRIIKMIKRLIYNNLHGQTRSDYIKAYWNLDSENDALIKQVNAYILLEKAKQCNDMFEKLHYLFESREIVSNIHLHHRDRDLFHRVKCMINMTQ